MLTNLIIALETGKHPNITQKRYLYKGNLYVLLDCVYPKQNSQLTLFLQDALVLPGGCPLAWVNHFVNDLGIKTKNPKDVLLTLWKAERSGGRNGL